MVAPSALRVNIIGLKPGDLVDIKGERVLILAKTAHLRPGFFWIMWLSRYDGLVERVIHPHEHLGWKT